MKLPALLPGDVLLFSRTSIFNRIIAVKTWSKFTHVEIVGQSGTTFASRNKTGCGHYPIDTEGLTLVRRVVRVDAFYFKLATDWFYREEIFKQGYDYLGLLNFFYAKHTGADNRRMFCSEFATRFLRQGGLDLFPGVDADTISPRDFTLAPDLRTIWSAESR